MYSRGTQYEKQNSKQKNNYADKELNKFSLKENQLKEFYINSSAYKKFRRFNRMILKQKYTIKKKFQYTDMWIRNFRYPMMNPVRSFLNPRGSINMKITKSKY